MSKQQYKHLTHLDIIQAGDEFWTGSAWFEYHEDCIGKFVHIDPSRRPIANAIEQPQRERIAYEELLVGDHIMDGDQWQNGDGRWQLFSVAPIQVREGSRVRRPYKISTILEIGDALAGAQKAATQLQDERDDALAALKSAQRARDELQLQVDELRAERKDEPTARQVRDMLRTWAIELDWSADCFDSVSREQIDIIQKTLIAVIERIEWLCSEDSDGN